MAGRTKSEEIEETDRIAGFAHPRENFRLVGQSEALVRAARALRRGKPPQAWLIAGPPGIGKATLAYRIARYLLKYGARADGPEDLSVPEKDPVSIQVAAGAHPGLLVLRRAVNPDTGRMMNVVSVDEVRKLGNFFHLTSGAGGWRVAIVDTADVMNDAAANALLKMLEEPPPRAMLLLLSNRPGRLLPTIRSRCQRLDLRALAESDVEAELRRLLPGMKDDERAELARLSGGSIGAALLLADGDGLELAEDAVRLIEQAANPDFTALYALAERIARQTDGLETFGHFLIEALAARIRARAGRGAPLRSWVEVWEKLNASFARARALHLEPRQTILSAAHAITAAARRNAI
ncbi:MAG TPA: DNA polymerase III subunit delta' [Rhizomicrobium sp.]|nr:DNA polymerase III subunit delta' [Rhizomicrobium sp.]